MELEVRADPDAYRRSRRWGRLFLLAFVLYVPAMLLDLELLGALIGREAAGEFTGAVFLAGFVALMGSSFLGLWASTLYRCPRCRRNLPKVHSWGETGANFRYRCEDCRVIWDLGWGPERGGA